MIQDLSAAQLRKAAQIKEKIDTLQSELNKLLGSQSFGTGSTEPRKKGRMSAEGRARIVAAQKARWAKAKANTGSTPSKAPKKKFTMSAEAKAKIAAAQTKRWAKQKTEAK